MFDRTMLSLTEFYSAASSSSTLLNRLMHLAADRQTKANWNKTSCPSVQCETPLIAAQGFLHESHLAHRACQRPIRGPVVRSHVTNDSVVLLLIDRPSPHGSNASH